MTITVTESVTVRFSRLLVTVADSVSVTELVNVVRSAGNELRVSVADFVAVGGQAPRQINVIDAVAIAEVVAARASRLFVNVIDTVSITEFRSLALSATFRPFWSRNPNQLI